MLKKYLIKKLKSLLSEEESFFPVSESIKISPDLVIDNFRNMQIDKEAEIVIEEKVQFRKFSNIIVLKNASLKICKNVFFNNYCSINCLGKITIGENTTFGEGVKIYDHNHKHYYSNDKLIVVRDQFNISKISIGKNCWIASNVTILKGAAIGDNVIIGANNLIYKSIPPNTMVKAKAEAVMNDVRDVQF